jgi:hypothetical protein
MRVPLSRGLGILRARRARGAGKERHEVRSSEFQVPETSNLEHFPSCFSRESRSSRLSRALTVSGMSSRVLTCLLGLFGLSGLFWLYED